MRFIKNWVVATFILCFLVIIAGGIVRTTQSGMGCPDWPRCFGKWIPPLNASELPPDFEKYLSKQDIDHSFNAWHTWIEYINRLLGVLLGLFAIVQAAVLFIKRKKLTKTWRLSLAFLLAVILTGLFGAIVVKYNLAHLSVSVHLLFAIILVQVQLALYLVLTNKYQVYVVSSRVKKMVIVFLCIIFIQSILGTMVRMHVDDISKMLGYRQRELWLNNYPVVFLIHRSFSWVLIGIALWLAWLNRNASQVKNIFFALAGTILLSMSTGIILSNAGMPAFAQPIHLLLAAIAITLSMAIVLQTKPAPVSP